MIGRDQDTVEHVGIEDAGLRNCGESQSDEDRVCAGEAVAGISENIVEVGALTSISEKIEFTAFGSLWSAIVPPPFP